MHLRRVFGALICVSWLAACGGSSTERYGYGREYVPADAEEAHYERVTMVSYEEVRREPQAFGSRTLGWFGTVTAVQKLPSGEVQLALELRFHQPRHLCTDQFESSCRVTVSERAGGPFSTVVRVAPEDQSGPERLNVGSLVKVYGSPTGEYDSLGGPMIKAAYYRHWPHGAFVTTSGSVKMRR
jgi:hypothetical protein